MLTSGNSDAKPTGDVAWTAVLDGAELQLNAEKQSPSPLSYDISVCIQILLLACLSVNCIECRETNILAYSISPSVSLLSTRLFSR